MKIQLVISNQTNPYVNVAVENYLLGLDVADTVTLYLWKNRRTVVIGQNQNPYAECNVDQLIADGGYVMRRRTGGGAVYHDDGNLNFSFIVPHEFYDQTRQFSVLQRAVESYGLHTEVSGRNDVLCEGRKFSGNAFNKGKYQHLHHGTILIKGNIEDLQRYLKVKPAKLKKHGVASVQSRVVNLSDLAPVTAVNIVPRLIKAFEKEYGSKAEVVDFDHLIACPEVRQLIQEMESPEWLFGRWKNFVAQYSAQFDWGLVELHLDVDQEHSIINHVEIASDGLDLAVIEQTRQLLEGASSVERPDVPQVDNAEVIVDILSMIY